MPGTEILHAAMPGEVDESRTGFQPVPQPVADRLRPHLVHLETIRHRVGRRHQRGQAIRRRTEIISAVRRIRHQHQLVLPIRAELRFIRTNLGDHDSQILRRLSRQAAQRQVGLPVAVHVRQQPVRGAQAVPGLNPQGRQMAGFDAGPSEIIAVTAARQHRHPRRLRPRFRRQRQQAAHRLQRACAVRQQIADILEDRHAGPQPLARAVIGQCLRGLRQRPRRHDQIIHPVLRRQEPGLRRRGFRRQHRYVRRFDHGIPLIALRRRPGFGGQHALSICQPGRLIGGIQRHHQRLVEGRRRDRRGADGHKMDCSDARRHQAVEFRFDPVQGELAGAAVRQQNGLHPQRIRTIRHQSRRDRQFGGHDLLAIELQESYSRTVEPEFRPMVRHLARARPADQPNLQRHVVAGMAGQVESEVLPAEDRAGGADQAVPVVIVIRQSRQGGQARIQILFNALAHWPHGRPGRGTWLAPRHDCSWCH